MAVRCFDQLVERLRGIGAKLPDPRTGENLRYTMADIALSAFLVFLVQSPSFLSFQQAMETARGHNNARSLFQIQRIPTDNHTLDILDALAPDHRFSLFDDLHQAFDQQGLLTAMRAVEQTRLIALDGTWYFSSQAAKSCWGAGLLPACDVSNFLESAVRMPAQLPNIPRLDRRICV